MARGGSVQSTSLPTEKNQNIVIRENANVRNNDITGDSPDR